MCLRGGPLSGSVHVAIGGAVGATAGETLQELSNGLQVCSISLSVMVRAIFWQEEAPPDVSVPKKD